MVCGLVVASAAVWAKGVIHTDGMAGLTYLHEMINNPGGSKGTDYYVDSVGGSDSNDGKTLATPFQTIAKLLSVPPGAYDRINLKKDSYWREEITVPADYMTIQSYGSGTNRPIQDCTDVIAAATWAPHSGTCYKAVGIPLDGSGSHPTWVSAWDNTTRMLRATSLANCIATVGTYWPSNDQANPTFDLYVNLSDGSDPRINGRVVSYTKRATGITGYTRSYVTVKGIETRRNLGSDGSLVGWRSWRIDDCMFRDGQKHNAYLGDGTYISNTTAQDAYFAGVSLAMFVNYEGTPVGLGVTYENCTAIEPE